MSDFDIFKCPNVPEQTDSWSCGLRVCLYARCLLHKGIGSIADKSWVIPIEEFSISDESVNQQALEDFCRCWEENANPAPVVKQEMEVDVRLFGSDQAAHQRPVATPARSLRVKVESRPPITNTNPVAGGVPVSKEVPAAAARMTLPKLEESEPNAKPTAPTAEPAHVAEKLPKSSGAAPASVKPEPATNQTGFEKELEVQIAQLLEQREQLTHRKRDSKTAKMVLAEANFSFNNDFQKAHSCKLEKGHWDRFLAGVLAVYHKTQDQRGLDCMVCRKLIQTFDIPAAAARVVANDAAKARKPAAPLPPPQAEPSHHDVGEPGFALVPIENGPEPMNKRPRRGRPPKGDKAEFNLLDFIASERAGQYELLPREQVGLCLGWGMEEMLRRSF